MWGPSAARDVPQRVNPFRSGDARLRVEAVLRVPRAVPFRNMAEERAAPALIRAAAAACHLFAATNFSVEQAAEGHAATDELRALFLPLAVSASG